MATIRKRATKWQVQVRRRCAALRRWLRASPPGAPRINRVGSVLHADQGSKFGAD